MKYIFLFIALGLSNILLAQNEADRLAFLIKSGGQSVSASTEAERLQFAQWFKDSLVAELNDPKAKEVSLQQVKNLSIQKTEDENLMVYTWVVPLKNGKYKHFGLIKHNGLDLIELTDNSDSMESPEYVWGKKENWYGAIYYDLRTFKYKKNTYYVLFGYRPSNLKTHEKLLEVITIDNDKIRFGAKIFETPIVFDRKYKQRPYRLLFTYSRKASASIKWNDNMKMIVMDHLSPPDASLQRQWEYYGPDFSYDGLTWEKGKFVLNREITVKSDIPAYVPKKAPDQGLEKKATPAEK